MHKVYVDKTCPLVQPVVDFLNEHKITHEIIDIDQDNLGRDQLRTLAKGFLSVPTIVMPNGTVLVEPSVFELQNFIVSQTPNQYLIHAKRREDQFTLTSTVYFCFIAGLIIFRLGISTASSIAEPTQLTSNILFLIVLLIATQLLIMIPIIRNIIRPITRFLSKNGFRVLYIAIYSFIAGLIVAISQANKTNIINTDHILLVFAIIIFGGISFGRLTRRFWVKPYDLLADMHSKLGWIITIGFIVVLAAYWILGQLGMQAAAAFLFGPLFFAFLLACLRTARGVRNGQIISHTSSLLFSCLGLIILFAMF